MGILEPCVQPLAPFDGVVPHGGLSSLWFETVGTPSGQRAAACTQWGPDLRVVPPDDGTTMGESVRGGAVRRSPAACRIGGLGFGTQGRVERIFRIADVDFLCPLCEAKNRKSEIGNRKLLAGF